MKIVGSLVILVSAIIVSYMYEKNKREEIAALREIYKLSEHIKNQIAYFSYPIKGIYENYKTENPYAKELINGNKLFVFDKEISEKINACFEGIGKGFKDEQINALEYLLAELKSVEKRASHTITQKIKVFRSIAMFIACCVIILLI